jgi:hypothetical protein
LLCGGRRLGQRLVHEIELLEDRIAVLDEARSAGRDFPVGA